MARSASFASDGTRRCSDPKQDAQGRWFCPACGRAEGFASKMAVLGHLRSCRPGKPALKELLGPPPAPASAPAVYVPSPSEVAQVNGLGAIMARLDQMASVQAQHSRALGNHIEHLSASTVSSATSSGVPFGWIVASIAGLGLVAAASQRSAPPPPQPVRNPFKEARARKDHRAMCTALEARRLAGESVEVPESCSELDDAPAPAVAAPAPAPKAAPVASIGELIGTATKALGLVKGLKGLRV